MTQWHGLSGFMLASIEMRFHDQSSKQPPFSFVSCGCSQGCVEDGASGVSIEVTRSLSVSKTFLLCALRRLFCRRCRGTQGRPSTCSPVLPVMPPQVRRSAHLVTELPEHMPGVAYFLYHFDKG